MTEYESKLSWPGGEAVHISTGPGGFVVANVNAHHSVVHGGYGNRANAPAFPTSD
ncbi:hypothetical protein AB0D24_23650 [Streptomyces javensis]|uniref:hypothetical protein n=1 Tax=Streptomyces javensis TaxID=114698 RepID=UPI0033DF2415